MSTNRFDIYLIGVGGQGIGLLAESLARAIDYAGFPVRGVDTHGLAQRGGTVESFLRLGAGVHSPLILQHEADMVVALERHEALRGASRFLRPGGTLVYYDAVWQPLSVRLRREPEATADQVQALCAGLPAEVIRVFDESLADARMQNVALMRTLMRLQLIPGVKPQHYESALADLLPGRVLEDNLALLRG
jgi:indolepyruvate ferredoxin oxidoreductase beta subunit